MARVTPEKAEQLSWPIVQIYSSIQTEILENIGALLAKDTKALEADINQWYALKLEQIGGLTRENIRAISKKSKLTQKKIREILQNIGMEGIEANEAVLQKAIAQGIPLMAALPVKQDPAIWQILDAFARQATDIYNLVNSTMLTQSQVVYRDILTQTVAGVISGLKTPQQALRSTVQDWAQKGIPALITADGKRRYAEGYAYTVIRTMGNNVANEMQDSRFDSYGVDLVEISSGHGPNAPRIKAGYSAGAAMIRNIRRYPAQVRANRTDCLVLTAAMFSIPTFQAFQNNVIILLMQSGTKKRTKKAKNRGR